ncbi:MAG: beta-N-acetylhexosaminidase, partial [Treponema sp.]|nr:beta-N-acetylhexosaminidase [Treponema sp.]
MSGILDVIPRPVSVRPMGGFCRFSGLTGNAAGKGAAECGVFAAQTRGIPVSEKGAGLRCVQDESLAEEAYRLRIESGGITLAGSSESGIYRGLQTLRQIVLSARGGDIPCAEIEDHPRFSWRGFMLDCSRHFFTAGFIKKIIDALSLHHINKFHWHLTDDQGWRLPVPSYPLLVEKGAWRKETRFEGRREGGFYTADEIRSIVRFAAARHVEIIPEVDLPGHTLSALASYPELGCTGGPYETEDRYGIFEDVLCAGNDRVFDFTEAVFGAMADLFPSPFVHIGGDEVRFNRWEACPKCKKRLAETGLSKPRELQSWITFRLAAMLAARGKIPIGWDEILEDSPKYPLPSEAVIMSWRGRQGGLDAARRGRRV